MVSVIIDGPSMAEVRCAAAIGGDIVRLIPRPDMDSIAYAAYARATQQPEGACACASGVQFDVAAGLGFQICEKAIAGALLLTSSARGGSLGAGQLGAISELFARSCRVRGLAPSWRRGTLGGGAAAA